MSKAYLTRHELADFLSSNGFPISASTLAKLSMPSRGQRQRENARSIASVVTGSLRVAEGVIGRGLRRLQEAHRQRNLAEDFSLRQSEPDSLIHAHYGMRARPTKSEG